MQEETFILSSLNRINISGCKNSCTQSHDDVYGKHLCYIKVLLLKVDVTFYSYCIEL